VRQRIFAGIAALCLIGALAAPARSQDRPSYASDEETIHGRIASISGRFDLEVRDDRGFIDRVQMHPGTAINPTGVQLEPGMHVTIIGHNSGPVFTANAIDTPYPVYPYLAYAPYPVYPVYPYPVYGGPRYSFDFRFGGFSRFGRRWR
jgi:hypothetical protein